MATELLRVELEEGNDCPKFMFGEFDSKKQYGAYAALGVCPRHYKEDYSRGILNGACLITELPYTDDNIVLIECLLFKQMCLIIPWKHRGKVTFIRKAPDEIIEDLGTIGWKYSGY